MSPEQTRKFNLITGSFFLGLGVVTWALAGYFALTPNAPQPHPVTAETRVDLNSCRTALATMGYQASIAATKDAVRVYEPLNGDAKALLDRATMAIGVCHMELRSFCIGEACDSPGVTFELVQYNPSKAKIADAKSQVSKPEPATRAKAATK